MKANFIDLTGSSFIITGAGSGIGRSVAILCSELGANLLLLDRNPHALAETQQMVGSGNVFSQVIDLTVFEDIEKALIDTADMIKNYNGFCHCAGIEYTLPIRAMTPKHYQDLFTINTIAGFELARIASKKKYLSERGASFVFIASIMGVVGRPGLTGYSASKGAVIAGMRSMALELAGKGIRVNCVSPGTVMTEMIRKMLDNLEPEQRGKRLGDFPLGIGAPEDVANLVAFLLSDRSKWITGTNVILDGGYTAR